MSTETFTASVTINRETNQAVINALHGTDITPRDTLQWDEVRALVEAAHRLYDICYFLTIEKVMQLGDDAMIAAGLGIAYNRILSDRGRFDRIDTLWAGSALAPFEEEK